MDKKIDSYFKEKGKLVLIILAMLVLAMGGIWVSKAFFSDTGNKSGSSKVQFGTVDISADGGSDSATSIFKITDIEGETSSIMPGTTISSSVRVRNIGTVDCYYLVCFICNNNVLASSFNNDYFYNTAPSTVTKSTLDNKLCGSLSANQNQTLNVSLTVSTSLIEDDLTSHDAKITCVVYAVQKEHITEQKAYYLLQSKKSADYPDSKNIMLYNADMTWVGDTTSNTSSVKLVYTDASKSQFYLDATSLSSDTTNEQGEDLYCFSNQPYDSSLFASKYATTDGSYLAKLSTANNYDLTYNLSSKYVYDTPDYAMNLYPVFLTPNAGDNDSSKNTYVKGTSDYVIYSKDSTEVPQTAFNRHNVIKAVVLPNTITKVSKGAFNRCTSLKYLTFPTSNLTSLGTQSFSFTSSLEYVYFPECINNFANTTSGTGAFAVSGLKSVYLNTNIENLSGAFMGQASQESYLTEVTFGPKCIYIKNAFGSFYNLPKLKKVTFTNVKSITNATQTFRYDSALESIDFGDSLETFDGSSPFSKMSNLTTLDFGDNLKTLNSNLLCYQTPKLSNVNFGSSLTTLFGTSLFQESALTTINLPNTLTKMGTLLFNQSNITGNVAVPGNCVFDTDSNGPFLSAQKITSLSLKNESGNPIKESKLYVERDGVLYKKLSDGTYRLEAFPSGRTGVLNIAKDVTQLRRFEVEDPHYITKYIVEEGNPSFKTDSYGVLFNASGTQLRAFPKNSSLTSYDVPNGVTEIYSLVSLQPIALTVPSTLTSFPGCAMQESKVKSINSSVDGVADLSNTKITFVGYKSFEYAVNLKHIILPSTCSEIQSGAFHYSGINEITTYYNGKVNLTNYQGYVSSGDLLASTGYDGTNYNGITKLHILSTLSSSIYSADSEWNVYISSTGSKPKLTVSADVTAK